MEEEGQAPPQREHQNYRSTASFNWRNKDESQRPDVPEQRRGYQPRDRDTQRGGYSQRRGYQQQDGGDIPTEVTTTRLYVGNLQYSAQSGDVEAVFNDAGFQVAHLTMSTDPMTGRNPGYCFVDMQSIDDAKKAMQDLNGIELEGRRLKVNPGVPKRSGDSAPLRVERRPVSGWRDGNNAPTDDGGYKPTFDRWNRNDAASHFNEPLEQQRRLYVGGLPRMEPQSAVDAEMQKLFSNLNIEITTVSKIISPHPSKESEPGDHYYLFVDLANESDVDAAIEALHGSVSPWSEAGGHLTVSRARNNRNKKVDREQGYQRNNRGFGGNERYAQS